jgi:NAD(P)H-dependent flavin oxidoreductase YrpB (nitropropane dioxygenase family)
MHSAVPASSSSSTPAPETARLPVIIQGGMGIGVSSWRLARAVARAGQLGVVSGTGLDSVFARRLQDGDAGGDLRRAMERFPVPGVAEDALRHFFIAGGRAPDAPYRLLPLLRHPLDLARQRFSMLASFVEVALAKEGHDGSVGMNLLTKVQLANLPLLYGAMLAGVDYILMGAGIPKEIPGALDALSEHRPAALRFEVEGATGDDAEFLSFDPSDHPVEAPVGLRRPRFLPIIASHSLAGILARKASGRVDGFVVEGPTAGGHNAPPRGEAVRNERGEPVYGARDEVDLGKMRELGLPFWLAGGAGHPDRLKDALAAGAAGVQVGTLFAFADESGMAPEIRRSVLAAVARGEVDVYTDAEASPTGYPFKVVHWPEDPAAAVDRERVCDVGYLRIAYVTPEGRIGYRCASEPEDLYVKKGGRLEDTIGRRCLCNSLLATVGLAQRREDGWVEPPLVTSGDDLRNLGAFLAGRAGYGARDVIDWLLGRGPEPH